MENTDFNNEVIVHGVETSSQISDAVEFGINLFDGEGRQTTLRFQIMGGEIMVTKETYAEGIEEDLEVTTTGEKGQIIIK